MISHENGVTTRVTFLLLAGLLVLSFFGQATADEREDVRQRGNLLVGRRWSDCGASSPQNDPYLGVSLLRASGAFIAAAS